jgi:phosphoglycerate dehydrogenase-like enzyme
MAKSEVQPSNLSQTLSFNCTKSSDISSRLADKNPELFKQATLLVTITALPESLADCPHLQLIHLFSAGSDRAVQSRLFKETDIPFTNSSGVHGPQIAEWLIMTQLVQAHHYNGLYELQKQKKWARAGPYQDFHNVRDMVGQRVGILGYGAIGRQVGRVVKAMGSTVLAYTATPKDTPEKRRDTGYIVPGTGDPDGSIPSEWYSGLDKESLRHFLGQDLDWVVVSVPLTPQTRHFLSTEEFDILSKRKALVSNIARGPIIDQPALAKALHEGKLRGAALDVTEPEPLPPDDPLWNAPNVIITPHISGSGTAYSERAFAVLEQNLTNREEGRPLINVVSRRKGY